MATNQDVIQAVAARLETISGIGNVHARTRFNADWSAYLNQFKADGSGRILGWMVTLADSNPLTAEMGPLKVRQTTYTILVVGVMGLKDEDNTEITFLNLAEAVMDDLDNRLDLGLAAVMDGGVGPSQMRLYQQRQFGSVLCHYTEILCPVVVNTVLTRT